eukprot:CAMPEP_0197433548 /NCGR_PEP_ID=MMETSP1175-20131217/1420_1 /TAXON_ID=1003142 /ORGANISM="Triceratium dubium, Strain CCMP147" /LENGTH=408 /DNA_ID=CAMNT_0042961965 /DNA_START=67 /DNA_END=1293 /DNA_ORIENTATION=+
MNIPSILGLTALLTAAMASLLASFLGYGRSVEYNDSSCSLIGNISPGSEDIVVVDNSLALVSAGDLDRMSFKAGGSLRRGEVFAVRFTGAEGDDDDAAAAVAERVPIEGMPDEARAAFHPHGIGFSNRTQLLYAVSHDCGDDDRGTSEVIEIFRLSREPALTLRHERSVKVPSAPLGGLNDVIEGARPGELYVTQMLSRPIDKGCAGNGKKLDELGQVMDVFFRRKSKVHRCTWDPTLPSGDATCGTVAEGFKGANGITADPERRRVFVTDSLDHTVSVFNRNDDGSLTLKDTLNISPYVLDNIEFDVASGKLTLSGSPRLYEMLPRMEGDASAEVSGGMITVLPQEDGSYQIEDVVMHDGSKLSMISSAVFVNGKILLGSPPSDGVLVCPIPGMPLASNPVPGEVRK